MFSKYKYGYYFRFIFLFILFGIGFEPTSSKAEPGRHSPPKLLHEFRSFSDFPHSASWNRSVPQVRNIGIRSTADGSIQQALYYDSGAPRKKPLLVALHSWSDNFRQKYSIPYARWAVLNDWVFIHPDYRGVFNNPSSTGSDLAIQDILDAVEYAKKNSTIDDSRVYLVGFSGGAMTALIMAGKYPDRWTAVSAWVPVYSLTDWYPYVSRFPQRRYRRQITSSCGGIPVTGSKAWEECQKRSPNTWLQGARGKPVRIYIAHGVKDDYVPVAHSLRAFNELANEADKVSEKDIEAINVTGKLPAHLAGSFQDGLYEEAKKPLLFRRSSANVIVNIFGGGHDVLFNPALLWLSEQTR